MTFSSGFQIYPWVERALAVRHNPIAGYGLTLAMVALAVFARWIAGEYVGARVPFITFFPAIVIAALIGGLWPGIVATVLCTLAAWYLFIPPYFSWSLGERELVQLLLFIAVDGVMVAMIVLLDALVERLVIQQQNIRTLLKSAPSAFVLVDRRGTIKLVNASTEKLFGYSREELTGKNVEFLVPEQHVGAHRNVRALYQKNPEARAMGLGRDLSGRRKDGTEFPVEIGLNPVGRDGKAMVLATVIDISARKEAHDSQQLIIRELHHRTQNLFAVIQSIAARSLVEGQTVAETKEILIGRLQALARAHTMLANAAWEGAPLIEIIKREFAGFSQQLGVNGCDIIVDPRAAHQFALIVHELATNALKHGALSAPDGRISIEGKIEQLNGQSLFSFLWKESGGPLVSAPTRKGFGSVVLLDAAKQFGQRVAVDYAPQGLSYELELLLSTIIASKNLAKQESSAALNETRAGSI